MKILMVNDYLERIGGAEEYMYTLVEGLRTAGHEVELFGSSVSREAFYESIGKASWRVLLRRLWNESEARRFKNVIETFKPEVVHIHSLYNELSPALLRYVGDARVVLTVHDQRLYAAVTNQRLRNESGCKYDLCVGCRNCVGLVGSWYARLRWTVHKRLFSRVDYFVFPSMFMKQLFERFTDLEPLVHLPNGFELPQEHAILPSKKIVFVGRLTRDKGVDVLLKAMKHVDDPEIVLEIVGDGEERTSLESLVSELSIEERVHFCGRLDHADVIEKIAESEAMAIPSRYPDNLPTVAIEALGVGRPILASDVGGLPELVEDEENGYLVEVDNAKDWANAINKLFANNKLREQMGSKSQKMADKFAIDGHVKKLEDLYITVPK